MINAIDPNQLLTQMRATQAQATQQPVANPQSGGTSNVDFSGLMKSAIDQVNQTQQAAGKAKTAFEMGDPNVSLADAMIASQKASVAFEATLQVRNKLVKAYEEVMRMSV
ncbi:MAG: flagellar hook-basal body complex protein FliE [Gammaproteobacteria bacterium]|nr:flagellar hook-basal body complex protein FliE [Gammaproteobacteria bacterium]MDH5591899.1 flagellar hook-basal body complex protein FliE [Gammaproteobacteria bacterium]